MKNVLFVPGFHADTDPRDYLSVVTAIEDSGYDVGIHTDQMEKNCPIRLSQSTRRNL